MSKKNVAYFIGQIIRVEGVLMLLPLICSVIYNDKSILSFAILAPLLILMGTLLTLLKPKRVSLTSREGFVIVGLSWIVLSVFGALPMYFSTDLSYIDCFFEIVSGFTTTGSSILTNVEALGDHGLYFWRSFTHWIGGMGVLVFILAIIPRSGSQSSKMLYIMQAEAPGPQVGKIVAKLKNTALITYLIYLAMTVIEFILLVAGGMPVFDSLLNTFGTAGTGGLAIKNTSIGFYQNPYFEYVIAIFMMLFAVNFNVYYLLLIGSFSKALRNTELWVYLGIIISSVAIISVNIYSLYNSVGDSIRTAFFQVTSIISTTGYATADFNLWPELSKVILIFLMFIGASAGSTGGGFKVSRLVILVKYALREIKFILNPRSVNVVKIDGKPVDHEVVRGTISYAIIYALIYLASVFVISLLEVYDLSTCFTSVASCFNNIGPGLSVVGPMGNFAGFCDVSKLLLSFDMLAGRLEIFPILMLFSPRVWKK